LIALFVALLVSVVITTVVLRYNHVHQYWTADADTTGVQKFHAEPVPRVGGLGIGIGLAAVWLLMLLRREANAGEFGLLLLCSLPAYFGGLAEDLTKRVSALYRLLLTMVAAAGGYFLLDAELDFIDVSWVDVALEWWPLAFALTIVAVGGVANAINIIDGYNGLSGVVACVILAALAYVAFWVNDTLVLRASLAMIGAILGFLLWNWPWGRIFLGDGGAYLVGFWIGELSVLLVARNPDVSPWCPLLLVAYPVVETGFSVYRRVVVRQRNPGLPDAVHLHQLIFRRMVRWSVGSREARHIKMRNSMTAPYLWLVSSLPVFPAMLLWQNTWALQLFFFAFAFAYVWFYASLVRFRTAKWMILRGRADPPSNPIKK
jgi:UDP-GlcNAc:undecaprenyl-phosphate/decaprenyl-phosphate GlcNAc-1-phosphate transferase